MTNQVASWDQTRRDPAQERVGGDDDTWHINSMLIGHQPVPESDKSNLKTMLSGANKSFGYAKYADRYLGAFAYRFKRRFELSDLVVRPIVDVCRGKPAPERVIRHA